jgi:predicted metalloprotease with PDZ domain
MRHLYQKFYKTKKRGFTEKELFIAIEEVITQKFDYGRELTEDELLDMISDITDNNFNKPVSIGSHLYKFQSQYVFGTGAIPYEAYFKQVGLAIQDENKGKNAPSLGIELDKNTVKFVKRGGSAFHAGLSAGDQIVSLDGTDVAQYNDWLKRQPVGKEVKITFLRDGLLRELMLTIESDNTLKFKALPLPEMTAEQARNYKKWLRK